MVLKTDIMMKSQATCLRVLYNYMHVYIITVNKSLPVQVIRKIYSDQQPRGRGVYGHVICGVVQELSTSVSLHVV